ncbi:hypothetical protein DH2020_048643 [Rehmannia glutinosa]|uniref:Uncharacterized protein n=1 Tax=Rehmannia glutinosa TaxID=99300 RepID=A0ABR0U541_REHGL
MWLFRRKGASGFSSSSTAEEVTNGIDGSGLTAIVTGASSGIGSETARVLALRGVHVVMGIRNMAAGNKIKETIIKEIPKAKVDAMELDLSSLASVRKFASDFTSSGRVMAPPFTLSKDNIELQFATNHLGHFLLANMLLDTMKKTARETKREGRIVNVSSEAHRLSYKEGIRFDKINDQEGYYDQSKQITFFTTLEQEDGAEITVNSLHPGVIATNLFRHLGVFEGNLGVFEGISKDLILSIKPFFVLLVKARDLRSPPKQSKANHAVRFVSTLGRLVLKNVQQGASTTCYVALRPELKGISGEYFSDNNLAKASAMATDKDLARKLWDFSLDLINK